MSELSSKKVDREKTAVIVDERVGREVTQSLMDRRYEGKVFDPLRDSHATQALAELRESWRSSGFTTVFTSGVFDLLHPNHRAYLLQTKLEAAPIHFERYHSEAGSWSALSLSEQLEYCEALLQEGKLRLVVSVDGDAAVATRKQTKDGARPIYGWQTRARDVLSATAAISQRTKGPNRSTLSDS